MKLKRLLLDLSHFGTGCVANGKKPKGSSSMYNHAAYL